MFSDAGWRRANTYASAIADLDLDNPQHVFMPLLAPAMTGARLQLFRVDVTTGHAELVKDGSMFTHDWIMDGSGKLMGRLSWGEHPPTDHIEVPDGANWREVASYDATGVNNADVVGMSDDGVGIVRLPHDSANGYRELSRLDPATGKEASIYSSEPYDVENGIRDPWTKRVIGAAHADDLNRYVYFDSKMEGLQQGLEAAFPGTSVHAVSWDRAKDKLIVAVEGPRRPLEYYYLDRTTHEASKIASTYPSLTDADLGERRVYPYTARDGLSIHAYLTLPPNKPAKNLPAIILPHGGPVDRDTQSFDWIASFFASRGYAVLQPNFRGSSGYGMKFEAAGFGQWGHKMQDDLSDGVKKIVADGIADPKRICIVGASYGGYAALAGAAFTPDLYACAVSLAGVSDLQTFVGTGGRGDAWNGSVWSKYMGEDWSRDKAQEISPAQHADGVKCPVLLMHGEVDTTVPIKQSEIMRDALKSANKSVEFIKLDSDSHYLQLADTRIRFLKETEAFLKKNIGN
jgi:acetyl esterase/lipase